MSADRPDILLIVLDAVRAENLSMLGYDLPTTPNLERFAEQFALFEACISPAIWTMPAVASLFTGTYPSTHRLVIDGDRLAEELITLPELLRREGYHTSMLSGDVPYLTEFTGLDRGFARCWQPRPPRWRRVLGRAARSGRRAVERGGGPEPRGVGLRLDASAAERSRRSLRTRASFWASGFGDDGAAACLRRVRELWREPRAEPKFVYCHLMEAHGSYRPPHRFRRAFLPRELRGRNLAAVNQRPNLYAAGLVPMDSEDFAILTALYDGCLAYLDEQVGALFDDLSRLPDWENTLVILTADHGDSIGRHGVLGHQLVCYEELLHVPLLVKWPRSVGLTGRQQTLVQTVDLFPTICALLGLERPEQVESQDLLSEPREVAFAELLKPFGRASVKQGLPELASQFDRAVLAARSARFKWLTHSNHQRDELYDLREDPRESRNLLGYGEDRELEPEARRLGEALEAWKPRWLAAAREIEQRVRSRDAGPVPPGVQERLRALGYLV